ncbi:MAG: right-handed parallel beta-helix repeat-containing protein [Candidatus Thorarchaeota archaeon SMTZ1-45]|nr:MAG: hypothetical protein AM325_15845 [Candidatus Thorarchaeota archaeon SMTZ1-45]
MPARVSSCILLLTLFMFLLALTPVADLKGTAAQSTTVVSEPEKWGIFPAGTLHRPIVIDGDANFFDTAMLEGWPGNGSPENPFIIDGLDIDIDGSPGSCISISNTRVSFTISNCSLTGASWDWLPGAGIFLENVTSGELVNNTCYSNDEYGIYLRKSSFNTVSDNTCNNNRFGICLVALHGNNMFNTVSNNSCSYNTQCGIYLDAIYATVSNNIVDNNTCTSNGNYGIYFLHSNDNIVGNNTCSSNGDYGIFLYNAGSSTVSDNLCNNNRIGIFLYSSGEIIMFNTVSNNSCSNNTQCGIYLDANTSLANTNLSNNTVINNTCSSNGEYGIRLHGSHHNTVTDNTCNNRVGIYLDRSDSNTVANNTCSSNSEYGISLSGSDSNTMSNNTCSSNGEYGIRLYGSHHNTVSDNTCNNNRIGIYLDHSDSNIVTKNTCTSNDYGIYLGSSDFNTMSYNICMSNTEHDISLRDSNFNTVDNNITSISEEFFSVLFLLIGFFGITLLGAGWWKVSARGDQDDIIVPTRYRLVSWFRERRALKHIDVDETLEPDSSDL